MSVVALSGPCGGCGEDVGPVHSCPGCSANMHPWCGIPQGNEGFGQPVLCPSCPAALKSVPVEEPHAHTASEDKGLTGEQRDDEWEDDDDEQRLESQSDGDELEDGETQSKPNSKTGKRKRQIVTTIKAKRRVVKWMSARDPGKTLFVNTVNAFPDVFARTSREAALRKAKRWFEARESLLHAKRGAVSISKVAVGGRRVAHAKSQPGRGRKASAWVQWLHPKVLSEFSRLRKLGLQFDMPLLRQVAVKVLEDSAAPYNKHSRDKTGMLLTERITTRWTQLFMEKHGIVLRAQTGKKQTSVEKTKAIRAAVAVHLGELKRGFDTEELDEDTIENVDETHFVIDFDTGKTLGFVGETSIKYADVFSGGEGMTLVVRITGGKASRVASPLLIFQNESENYPIRGVPDDVQGVCYRTGKKGWMDQRVFREYLNERRAMWPDQKGRLKTIYLDNCGGHLSDEQCPDELLKLNARLCFFPANATDLCQPADSFVIAKLKDIWSRKWNAKKLELINSKEWQNKIRKDGAWSGKLKNPGKHYFLELASECVKELNTKQDKNDLSFARKAMIRCGMSLGVDGKWSVEQLYPHLQEIIREFPKQFAGLDL